MKKDLFSIREEEIFLTLKELKNCKFTVIGGYAVNAYALPRFSVDCDIVIRNENELGRIDKILIKRGYKKAELTGECRYFGAFSRYEKRLENNFAVSIDILIHTIKDRMTGAEFSAEWVFENSNEKILKGKTITEELKLQIINMDALLVMKIISCRSTDIRDIFMMMLNAKNEDWIRSEIMKRYNLKERTAKIIEKIASKQFRDGLSGIYGYFDEKVFEKHKKAILKFQEEI